MASAGTSRRRRTPKEAKAEILDAAEAALIEHGPAGIKFQVIADKAGLSVSNVHHHFGGLDGLKRGLSERMTQRFLSELTAAVVKSRHISDRELRIETALKNIYAIISTERHAKLMAWVVLATNPNEDVPGFVASIRMAAQLITAELQDVMPAEQVAVTAPAIIYQVTLTALGEGLFGNLFLPMVSNENSEIDVTKPLLDMLLNS